MAVRTSYFVQTFKKGRGGKVVPGDKEIAPTENGAMKRAAAMGARLLGTAALKIVADDETGEVQAATVLSQHGEVPEDFAESLRGG